MKRLFFVAIVFVVAFVLAPHVYAHANFVRSDPAPNSALPVPPTHVRVWFSEEIEPAFTTLAVFDTNGSQRDLGNSQRVVGEPAAMQVSLTDLSQGLYTVVWKALSAVDGHVTTGSFVFTIGSVPLSQSAPREIIALVDNALAASAPPPLYQVVTRWLNLVALAVLVGAMTFPLLIFFPALALGGRFNLRAYFSALRSPPADEPGDALDAWYLRWWSFARVAVVLFALATVGMLIMQAVAAGVGLESILRVLQATRFGTIWLLRLALLLILGVLVFRDPTSLRGMTVGVLLGTGLLFTQSLTSHNAAVSDPPFVALVVDTIHLLATAIWVGGLFQLVLTIPAYLRELSELERPRVLANLIATFSFVAFVSVGVLVISGAYSMLVQVGSLEAFFGTLYGAMLVSKFVLLLPLLALGALNLLVARPAFAAAIASRARTLIARFRLTVALEVSLALGVLLAVGVLTSVMPAKDAYDPSPELMILTRPVDDLEVTLGIAPGLVGTNDYDVHVRTRASGEPVANATVVRLLGSMPGMEMGVQEVAAVNQGGGHYTLRSDLLSMVGLWSIEVLVRRDNQYDARVTFNIAALGERASPVAQFQALGQPDAWVGLGITVLAFAFGAAVVLTGRGRQRATLVGLIVLSALGVLLVYRANARVAQSVAAPFAPDFARALRSPLRPDATQIAAGRLIYAQNCAICHGVNGKGDGPSASALSPRPSDLTLHARQHSEGELFWWITNGIPRTAMPAWDAQLTELQRWQVVQFIRTLGDPAQ